MSCVFTNFFSHLKCLLAVAYASKQRNVAATLDFNIPTLLVDFEYIDVGVYESAESAAHSVSDSAVALDPF